MQKVSELYRREQQKQFAGPVRLRISFGLVDSDAATDAVVSTSVGLSFSTPQTALYEEGVPPRVYATLEPGRMKLDGRQLVPPQLTAQQHSEGFVSTALCGADGAFAQPPVVALRFGKQHTVPALSFVFDRATGDHPRSLRICAWRGEHLVCDRTVNPAAAQWVDESEIERFDRLELHFLAMAQPHRRARLQQLLFGVGMELDGRVILSANQKLEVDPISRRLPQGRFSFSLANINQLTDGYSYLYNPDNPQGLWRYMESRSPIRVSYGQTITEASRWADVAELCWAEANDTGWGELYGGGQVVWVPGGRYYLDAAPTLSGLEARFAAEDLMGMLDGRYDKGSFDGQPHSLYSLAEAVLTDAGLPQIWADRPPWELWEGLKSLYTTAPLPQKPCRELLQLIAHAACCVLYVNREGVLQLRPMGDRATNLVLAGGQLLGEPKVSKTATLYRVDCPVYSYRADSSGGYQVERQQQVASAMVANADPDGVVERLNNPLITDLSRAQAVAVWVRDYLCQRTTYQLESRGHPECDPLDSVTMDSTFDVGFAAVVLKNETVFDGALRSKLTCKRRRENET